MIPICGLPIDTLIYSFQRAEIEEGKLNSFNLFCVKKIEYPTISVIWQIGYPAHSDPYSDTWYLQIDEGIYTLKFSKDDVDSENYCYLNIKGTKECSLEVADKLLNYFTRYENSFREKLSTLDNDKLIKITNHYFSKDIWYEYFLQIEGESTEPHNKLLKEWLCRLISSHFDIDTLIKDGFLQS